MGTLETVETYYILKQRFSKCVPRNHMVPWEHCQRFRQIYMINEKIILYHI